MSLWRAQIRRRWAEDADRVLVTEASGQAWRGADLAAAAAAWQERLVELDGPPGAAVGLGLPNGGSWLAVLAALADLDLVAVPREPMTAAEWQTFGAAVGLVGYVDQAGVHPLSSPRRPRRREDVVLWKVTSGSTGQPRALPFTAAQMIADGTQVMAGMALQRNDLNLAHVPFGHSYGLGNLVMPLLLEGLAVAVVNDPLPHALAAACAASRATVLPTVPAVVRALVAAAVAPADLAGLRLVISAGARLEPALAAAFLHRFGRPVHNFYGSTETGGIAYDASGEETLAGRSVGHPLPGVVVNAGRGGSLEVSSPAVMTVGTRRRVGEDGAVRVADRGSVWGDGAILLTGRRRGFAKRGGHRIGLAEVEQAAMRLTGVQQALALAVVTGRGEQLALAVETTATAQEVRAALREVLSARCRPDLVRCWPRFPLTPRGKIDHAALTQAFADPTT